MADTNSPRQGVRRGYARVSTDVQDLQAQRDILESLGVEHDRIYADVISGGTRHRPNLDRLLDDVREGDTVVVTRLDRLARSVPDLCEITGILEARGAALMFDGQLYDPLNPSGRLLFMILGAVAEFERSIIRARTREGMALARARGKLKGKPPKLSSDQEAVMIETWERGDRTVAEVAQVYGVSRATLYRALERAGIDPRSRRTPSEGLAGRP